MKKTVKLLCALLVLVLATALLSGCGGKVPDRMDEDTVIADTHTVIDAVNAMDYAELAELSPKIGFSEEDWQEALGPYATAFGSFERYGDAKFVTGNTDDFGEVVSVYQEAVYTEQKVVWMVSFTTSYECVGLRISAVN